jgi:hypothetical protein
MAASPALLSPTKVGLTTLTLVSMESATQTVAFGGRPGPLRTPPEASQAAKLGPHGPLGMAKTDIYFSHQ